MPVSQLGAPNQKLKPDDHLMILYTKGSGELADQILG